MTSYGTKGGEARPNPLLLSCKEGAPALDKLKNRIINFRVTDEELARLKSASSLHGARCLSEFARMIMLGTSPAPDPPADGHVNKKIQSLESRLEAVEFEVSRVMDLLEVEKKR